MDVYVLWEDVDMKPRCDKPHRFQPMSAYVCVH